MRYRHVLFDLDGTLFDYRKAETAALEAAFARAGLRFQQPYVELYRRINQRAWLQLERGEATREEIKVRRFVELLDGTGQGGVTPTSRAATRSARCTTSRASSASPDFLQQCAKLSEPSPGRAARGRRILG